MSDRPNSIHLHYTNTKATTQTPEMNALFIFNSKGDILMSKFFREGVKKNVSDVFRIQVINSALRNHSDSPAANVRLPVLTLGLTSFMYIRTGFLWVVAVTRSNQDLLLVFEYLLQLVEFLKRAFSKPAAETLLEEEVVANFTTIFDILDELVQFGFPTSLEAPYLTSVVPGLSGVKIRDASVKKSGIMRKNTRSAIDASYDASVVLWRPAGIKYRKNEIFLNVDEKLNVLLNLRGDTVRAYIDGTITMKSQLSGMPVCRFGFSDDLAGDGLDLTLDDFKFHQCVELAHYDAEHVIRFVPPDGSFQLMTYHVAASENLPFQVVPTVTRDHGLIGLKIMLRSTFSRKLCATNVVVRVPTPPGVTRHLLSCSNGKAKYVPEDKTVQWRFSRMYGESENVLNVDLGVLDPQGWKLLTVDFTLEMFSASGLAVKFLKVMEKANYRTVKWVKYTTYLGSYEVRL